jgi:hypothetical protein
LDLRSYVNFCKRNLKDGKFDGEIGDGFSRKKKTRNDPKTFEDDSRSVNDLRFRWEALMEKLGTLIIQGENFDGQIGNFDVRDQIIKA